MKFLSYIKPDGTKSYGLIKDGGVVDLQNKSKLSDLKQFIEHGGISKSKEFTTTDLIDFKLDEIKFLPVIENPKKILCVGMNYKAKCSEFNVSPAAPTIFIRFPDSQTAHLDNIIKPAVSNELDYEGELAIIIGRSGSKIPVDKAHEYIAGYSCYMDGSVRDWQYSWFTAGKNFRKTGGFGPFIVSKDDILDPQNLQIKTWVNDLLVQNEKTSNMIYSISELIAYISSFTHLSPGDVILTGSPGGVGCSKTPPLYLKKGDVVRVEIESVGCLTNFVVDE